jgi:hypothetical protein
MKRFGWSLALAAMGVAAAVFVSGCESGGDDPGGETSITGNSTLRVTNTSNYETTTYFDGDYIGSVAKDSSRSWRVPSGTHTVRFDNADVTADPISGTYTFQSGGTWTITVTWKNVGPF